VGTFECDGATAAGSGIIPKLREEGPVFSISAAWWHDKSYHNGAQQHREKLICEADEHDLDVRELESAIPSGKTISVDKFLEHIKVAVEYFPRLYEHYKQERPIRWKTYRKEQKAMYELCMLVKGDPSLEKKHVVVAYGAGQFSSTMRGLRPMPVKRFLEELKRYVTVVLTDENHTSQKCSKCSWGQEAPKKAADASKKSKKAADAGKKGKKRKWRGKKKEEKKNREKKKAEDAKKGKEDKKVLIPVHGERSANGSKGPPLHAVRYCVDCNTIWHRDVNAARNIARMFWWLRCCPDSLPPLVSPPSRDGMEEATSNTEDVRLPRENILCGEGNRTQIP